MKLLLDTANLDDIRYIKAYYPITGVTTNPTILSKEGGDVIALLDAIRETIGDDAELHIQATERDYDGIISEAVALTERYGSNTFIKIPITDIGMKVTKFLTSNGYKVTVTAVLSSSQAMLASCAGADYVAPYVGRIDNISGNGIETVSEIADILNASNSETQILAASFKTARQVIDCALSGAHAATVGTDVLKKLASHPTTDTSIKGFNDDWNRVFGNKTLREMLSIIK